MDCYITNNVGYNVYTLYSAVYTLKNGAYAITEPWICVHLRDVTRRPERK
jgi:hypothetical protein